MTAHRVSRRAFLEGAMVVGFSLLNRATGAFAQGVAQPGPDATAVDSFLAVNADGSVTVFCGKVDLGQGLRIAMRQMAAEELGIGVDRINLIEGDTDLTPDQGPTAGSSGVMRGGVQIRQAAATARQALLRRGADRLGRPPEDLAILGGEVRPKAGGSGIALAELMRVRSFELKLDPKAPLADPATYALVGQSLPRPDVPAKCAGVHVYVHDFTLPGMLHARVIRPPAIGARLLSVDESAISHLPAARVVRLRDFLAVVAEDEWIALKAADALRATWTDETTLPDQTRLAALMREGPFTRDETLVSRGSPPTSIPSGAKALAATYFWPMQTHGSMGPSCAVADVRPDHARIWTASQGTHRYRNTFAQFLRLPPDKVRLIYLDGAGCYGMNGHEDAAADAAILSQMVGRPVRVQWMRHDEHGWDPKGPPQLLDLAGVVDGDGRVLDWRTEMWLPEATKGLPNIPLLAPAAAGLGQPQGLATGLISQNGDPPYAVNSLNVVVHWLKDAPLRPSNIRAPGKIANSFAVESFTDELAAAAGQDPIAFRLAKLSNPRGIEVVKRAAAMMDWQSRPSPGPTAGARLARGRGFSYVHYKHNESLVAIGMEVAVERERGAIHVERVVCAHDCGLVINPDAVKAQVEGNIIQTLSRALYEEVRFDRSRVTSLDWASYPILTFSAAPAIEIELVDRRHEPPLGAGEASAAPVAAALGNAVFDATGLRLRTVPFTPERVKAALERQGM